MSSWLPPPLGNRQRTTAALALIFVSVVMAVLEATAAESQPSLFDDGFESGDTSSWSNVVGAVCILGLVVTPENKTVIAGETVSYTATAFLSSGSSEDDSLHPGTSWSATPDPDGSATFAGNVAAAETAGTVEIRATHTSARVCGAIPGGSVTDTAALQIDPPLLESLEVDCGSPPLPIGFVRQCIAYGNYSNGATADETEQAEWSSADAFIAEVSNQSGSKGRAEGISPGTVSVNASLGIVGDFDTLTVADCSLSGVTVKPPHPSWPIGFDVAFYAYANYGGADAASCVSDITMLVDWSATNASIADNGANPANNVFTTSSIGTTDVSATHVLTAATGSTTLTVTGDEVVAVAIRDPHGCLVGTPVGLSCQVELLGTYSDGSQRLVTMDAAWSTLDEGVAAVEGPGLVRGIAPGTTTLTADLDELDDTATFSSRDLCLDAPELGVAGHPSGSSILVPSGVPVRFVVTGLFSPPFTYDLTSHVSWASSSPSVLPPPAAGELESMAVQAGTTTVSAAVSGVTLCAGGSSTAELAVQVSNGVLQGLAVEPLLPLLSEDELPLGWRAQYRAIGDFGLGESWDITSVVQWRSANLNVATIHGGGELTTSSTQIGQTVIAADWDQQTASRVLNVVDEVLVAIAIDAKPYAGYSSGTAIDWPEGELSLDLGLVTEFSSGTMEIPLPLTSVVWSSDHPAARVGSDTGRVTSAPDVAMDASAGISAMSGAVSDSVTLVVRDEAVTELQLIADGDGDLVHDGDYVLGLGSQEPWVCLGRTGTSGTWYNLNVSAVFFSANPALVAVSNAPATKGVVSRLGAGIVGVECRVGALSTSALAR